MDFLNISLSTKYAIGILIKDVSICCNKSFIIKKLSFEYELALRQTLIVRNLMK